MTRVGVAICTYRRPEGLARLLAALPAGAPEAATVIVVDNDGGDPRVAAAVAAAHAEGRDVRLFEEIYRQYLTQRGVLPAAQPVAARD